MNYTEARKLLLKVFIGFLSMTALVAILSVLSRNFGEPQIKVLATTFSIAGGSICAMACAGFIERKGGKAVGIVGILAASVAAPLVIIGVWGDIHEHEYWKTTETFIVLSIALAQVCLLHSPNLAASYRWTQPVSAILIGLLALQISVAVWGEIKDEGYYRFMAALSVLVVLATLVVPICSRLGAKADEGRPKQGPDIGEVAHVPEQLVLHRLSGAIFADQLGRRYEVTEIQAGPGDAANGGSGTLPGDSGDADIVSVSPDEKGERR